MDAKRLQSLRDHIDGDAAENVEIHAKDFCELVETSRTDDEGLKKAAGKMNGHVGFLVVNREKVCAMLPKAPAPSNNDGGGNKKPK